MKNCPEQELERWGNPPVTDFPDGIDPVWDAPDFGVVGKFFGGFTGLKISGCGLWSRKRFDLFPETGSIRHRTRFGT